MAKALIGYLGAQPPDVIYRELRELKARVEELERALAAAERELSLRADDGFAGVHQTQAAMA